jgi:hypothetical protein
VEIINYYPIKMPLIGGGCPGRQVSCNMANIGRGPFSASKIQPVDKDPQTYPHFIIIKF